MTSPRLTYSPLAPPDLDDFHRLVVDEHVLRYLFDGAVHARDASAERIAASQDLFTRCGVGLWLARDAESGELLGFCGFMEILDLHPEPQLAYALFERWTGRGFATEMGRAAIAAARGQPGFAEIVTTVDAPNAASRRVLEKLGFEPVATRPGAFGDIVMLRLSEPGASARPRAWCSATDGRISGGDEGRRRRMRCGPTWRDLPPR